MGAVKEDMEVVKASEEEVWNRDKWKIWVHCGDPQVAVKRRSIETNVFFFHMQKIFRSPLGG